MHTTTSPGQAQKICWVFTLGIPGMDNQSLGVAERLGMQVIQKRIYPKFPWKNLPPALWINPLKCLGPESDPLSPPWPDMIIGTGRLTVAPALAIKKASGGKTFNIHIQDPYTAYQQFDLIITPLHDKLRSQNSLKTVGGLHLITPERLEAARQVFESRFAHLPRPWIAVMVGGNNRYYKRTAQFGRELGSQLAHVCAQSGGSLLVTTSRRTGPEVAGELRAALAETPHFFWDGEGENPYYAFLAMADAMVVTADSVNMVSEACTTGKPVYVAGLEDKSRKSREFHEYMFKNGYTRPFTGTLEHWEYPPLDDMSKVANRVLQLFNSHP